jgi:hypothetical protein
VDKLVGWDVKCASCAAEGSDAHGATSISITGVAMYKNHAVVKDGQSLQYVLHSCLAFQASSGHCIAVFCSPPGAALLLMERILLIIALPSNALPLH